MFVSPLEILFFLLPSVTGYGVAQLCLTTQNAGECVDWRPPGYVFGIAWAILYILLGISFIAASRKNFSSVGLYLTLIATLSAWVIVYSCQGNKMGGIYVILAAIALAIGCFVTGDFLSAATIAPLIAWLLFALALNIADVRCSAEQPKPVEA